MRGPSRYLPTSGAILHGIMEFGKSSLHRRFLKYNMSNQLHTVPKKYQALEQALRQFPEVLEGKITIPDMKNSGYHNWRQTEWPAFSFEDWASRNLSGVMTLPGSSYGATEFDAFLEHDWDLKVHSTKNANGRLNGATILNDGSAMEASIAHFGKVGFIELFGEATFDTDGSFKVWHDEFKGAISKYAANNRANNTRSRKLKTAFVAEGFNIYLIDANKLKLLNIMKQGRNSNGAERKYKYSLRHAKVAPDFSIVL